MSILGMRSWPQLPSDCLWMAWNHQISCSRAVTRAHNTINTASVSADVCLLFSHHDCPSARRWGDFHFQCGCGSDMCCTHYHLPLVLDRFNCPGGTQIALPRLKKYFEDVPIGRPGMAPEMRVASMVMFAFGAYNMHIPWVFPGQITYKHWMFHCCVNLLHLFLHQEDEPTSTLHTVRIYASHSKSVLWNSAMVNQDAKLG